MAPASQLGDAIAAAQNVALPVSVGGNVVTPQIVIAQQPVTTTDAAPGDNAQTRTQTSEAAGQGAGSGTAPAVRNNIGVLPPVLRGMGLDVIDSGVNLAFASPAPDQGARSDAAPRQVPVGDNAQEQR